MCEWRACLGCFIIVYVPALSATVPTGWNHACFSSFFDLFSFVSTYIYISCILGAFLSESVLSIISKFGNNWRCVLIYGGVLSLLFVKFSRIKNVKFGNIPIFGGEKQENMVD